jgi:hypothetical protein
VATFDQRNQQVTYQYNAAGNINFGAVQNGQDLARELGKLGEEVDKAATNGVLKKGVATDVKYQIDKATQQAEEPEPDKDALLGHLESAKELVGQVTAAAGMVTGLVQVIDKVRVLF